MRRSLAAPHGNASPLSQIRMALCGWPVSPPIFDTLYLLGREEVLARLERWIG